jgi:hypothetical protein
MEIQLAYPKSILFFEIHTAIMDARHGSEDVAANIGRGGTPGLAETLEDFYR